MPLKPNSSSTAAFAAATETTAEALAAAQARLNAVLAPWQGQKLALAFSGGTDSSLLLALLQKQCQQYGGEVIAIMASTTLQPKQELTEAQDFCQQLGVPMQLIRVDELPLIKDNPIQRCYLCKKALMSALQDYSHTVGCTKLFDGTNADDLKQFRPGLKALQELQVLSPLAKADITKAQVRALLQELGLRVAHKPSSPCLATRFPYGTPLKVEQLQAIGQAEEQLHALGFYNVRLRAHPQDKLLRLEVDPQTFPLVVKQREEILEIMQAVSGYQFFSLDLEGFRSGSMDQALQGLQALKALPSQTQS